MSEQTSNSYNPVCICAAIAASVFALAGPVIYAAGSDGILASHIAPIAARIIGTATVVRAAEFERYYPWLLFAAAIMLSYNLRQAYFRASSTQLVRAATWVSVALLVISTVYSVQAILTADWV